jgi:5-bromo-4-chloroindolyl phosphate hydrolysis protein
MARDGDGGVQAVKLARNQALWREVNERVKAVAETTGNMEFLCECADMDCIETVKMNLAEYEHIRSSPVRFPIALGHVYPDVENVVEENERYAVVEKVGEAGEITSRLDPRSPA